MVAPCVEIYLQQGVAIAGVYYCVIQRGFLAALYFFGICVSLVLLLITCQEVCEQHGRLSLNKRGCSGNYCVIRFVHFSLAEHLVEA